MKYGLIDTATLNPAWVAAAGLDETTVAVAMGLPGLTHGGRGMANKGGGLRRPGLGTLYLAMALEWAVKGTEHASRDNDYFAVVRTVNPDAPASNKTVYLGDLAHLGLIKRFGKPGAGQQVV